VYFSVECPFYKFDGINYCPKLDAKLLNRFFHGWRQVNPAVKNAMHRFFTVYYATRLRGAANGKAKRELNFRPRPLEWLDGANP
jgi:hypothetical protein